MAKESIYEWESSVAVSLELPGSPTPQCAYRQIKSSSENDTGIVYIKYQELKFVPLIKPSSKIALFEPKGPFQLGSLYQQNILLDHLYHVRQILTLCSQYY